MMKVLNDVRKLPGTRFIAQPAILALPEDEYLVKSCDSSQIMYYERGT